MSKNSNNNLLFCSHNKKQKENTFRNIIYSYCEDCGNISIKHNDNFYFTIKPKLKQKPVEINPILLTQLMKLNQEKSYPNLYNIYNLDIKDNISNIKEKISIYFAKRKIILLYLQNITRTLNYTDLSFYHSLLLVDLYLTRNITEEMTEEDLLYIIIGFFLVSSKLKENDIFEPELINFNNINSNIILSTDKVKLYETKCLKYINYKYFIYSTYDWINIFISNGYIFEDEIENKEYISEIHTYTYRLLISITPKNMFIKYSTFYMAISLIQITREDKIDENKIKEELFEKLLWLYNIKKKDYEDCYREIKLVINREKNINNSNNKSDKSKINTSRNQTPSIKKIENNIKIIDINLQSKSNLKKKLKETKLKKKITNLTSSGKAKRNFHSIIVHNMNNPKNRNFNIYKKNLEILEYINTNLPNIYNNGTEININKTEGETISGMNYQIGKFKNDTLNNFSIKDIKLKTKLCSSVEHQYLKKIDLNKTKKKVSPLKIKKYMRNGMNEFLEEREKYSKFLYKNSTNIFHTDNNSLIFNKSGDTLNHYNNTSSNNSNNNIKNDEKEKVNIIIENYYNNKNKINNNFNIYKNYKNIFKNNLKPLYRDNTSDYLGNNNTANIIKSDGIFVLNIKKDGEYKSTDKKTNNMEKLNSSIEKEMKILSSRNTNYNINTKSFFINLKNDKSILNNHKDLLLKKSIYNNISKLPKLKLKIEK